jgi:hypothetical protein
VRATIRPRPLAMSVNDVQAIAKAGSARPRPCAPGLPGVRSIVAALQLRDLDRGLQRSPPSVERSRCSDAASSVSFAVASCATNACCVRHNDGSVRGTCTSDIARCCRCPRSAS